MQIIRTSAALRNFIIEHVGVERSIGFVPTMGALHDGHKALMLRSVAENDISVVSVFVNPAQFNNAEDLSKYPRQEEADFDMVLGTGADAVFAPSVEEMYPNRHSEKELFHSPLFEVFEGAFRPGHFAGVVTIVRKFFDLIKPTRAYFGEKDFQQLAVIRAMVRAEKWPIQIVACPTVRESSGLAMSSRNQRLSPGALSKAPALYRIMCEVKRMVRDKTFARQSLSEQLTALKNEGFEPEYFAVIDPDTFEEKKPEDAGTGDRLIAAAWLDGVRLIDNLGL